MMCGFFILFLVYLMLVALTLVIDLLFKKKTSITARHVLITGGSSGIGKALAIECFSQGANVTILARNKEQLEGAKAEIEKHAVNKEQKVTIVSVDVSREYESVEAVVLKAEDGLGPIDLLINCAGTAIAGRFEDMLMSEFKRMMDINYFGSVFVTRAVLPKMKERRNGTIVFVSSIAGLFGLYGYSAYSASKCALKGLAECLQMEVKPFNIRVTIAYPPDTNTPGFAIEERTKPIETKQISQSGGLLPPETVAKQILNDALNGCFSSTVGLEGWMLGNLCCGMSPVSSYYEAAIQILFMGPFRLIGIFCLRNFDRIIEKCAKKQNVGKDE